MNKKLEQIVMIGSFVAGVSLFSFGDYKDSNAWRIPGLLTGTVGAGMLMQRLVDYNNKPEKQKKYLDYDN